MPEHPQLPDGRIAWPREHEPSSALVFAQNTIDVAASAQTAWSLLINCVRWPRWYKHCTDVSILRGGPSLSAGSQFRFKTLGFYFEPEIVTFEPDRLLVWSAKGPAGTSGAHAWFIEPTRGGCRVITEESQRGALLYVMRARTRRELLTMHAEWLRSLKELAEAS